MSFEALNDEYDGAGVHLHLLDQAVLEAGNLLLAVSQKQKLGALDCENHLLFELRQLLANLLEGLLVHLHTILSGTVQLALAKHLDKHLLDVQTVFSDCFIDFVAELSEEDQPWSLHILEALQKLAKLLLIADVHAFLTG